MLGVSGPCQVVLSLLEEGAVGQKAGQQPPLILEISLFQGGKSDLLEGRGEVGVQEFSEGVMRHEVEEATHFYQTDGAPQFVADIPEDLTELRLLDHRFSRVDGLTFPSQLVELLHAH